MNGLHRLQQAGQSVWYDNIRRGLLASGELARYIQDYAVTGVTSNPTIFERAITSSADYDDGIRFADPVASSVEELFSALAVDDVAAAADLLHAVYEDTGGRDGYVALDVSPALAHDAGGTVAAAQDLFARVGRPNVMITVPGTGEGLAAVEELVAAGVNINVTLLFSTAQYAAAADAWVRGMERRAARGAGLGVASVASVFVSRWDAAADPHLPDELRGTTGVASARMTYACYRGLLASDRWTALMAAGAAPQRVLWASTGTKDPTLPDTYYLTALAAPDTVATVPEPTLLAFADHGEVGPLLDGDRAAAEGALASVSAAGIDLEALAADLQEKGVAGFAESFDRLLLKLESKAAVLRSDDAATAVEISRPLSAAQAGAERLGPLARPVEEVVADLAGRDAVRRAYARDHTLWQEDPTEVADRLGWIFSPAQMEHAVDELEQFAKQCAADGLSHAVLMGMGGSSLFPEVMVETFGAAEGRPELLVLDTTDPAAIARVAETLPLDRTLFLAASKSGGTIETRSQLELFWDRLRRPEQFAVVTDPGSDLGTLGRERGFRKVFENRPDIGGRYSALSHFGLVPAALLGVDVCELLDRAGHMAAATAPCVPPDRNPALRLGAVMGAAARAGRDKLTIVLPPAIESFGLWLEQLIAESTGKEGTGVLPVVGEPLGPAESYGDDRLFVAIGSDFSAQLDALAAAGHPVVELPYTDPFDVGAEVFRWEWATCLAGAVLGINPFNQPNVAEAKAATARVLAEDLPELAAEPVAGVLEQLRAGDYFSIHAYVDPWSEVVDRLQRVRVVVRDRFRVATTLGIGPRFLHSTGQFHKGGPPTGVFVQVVGEDDVDVPVPGQPFGFATLIRAQAAGDLQTLQRRGLRAARVSLDDLLSLLD
ncbi:MAG TPA: bifunctional transaldolase/phosoglucose isomerase [Acidimicrobiales bacterium]|nr:bifunctional transaldolase/phosoglucose isomerase [Acidimicrobiales bacterium]